MSFITDLPKDLQILISNYEPKFILVCDNTNWHFLIRQNFGLEFQEKIPSEELQVLYIEK